MGRKPHHLRVSGILGKCRHYQHRFPIIYEYNGLRIDSANSRRLHLTAEMLATSLFRPDGTRLLIQDIKISLETMTVQDLCATLVAKGTPQPVVLLSMCGNFPPVVHTVWVPRPSH